MTKQLEYAIDYLQVAYENPNKAILEAKILSIETENYHGTWFKKKYVDKALPSLANIPILGLWDGYKLHGHAYTPREERALNALGIVPETNKARYEKDENGIEYLVCTFVLWKNYHSDIINHILKQAKMGHKIPLSMEIVYDADKAYKENGQLILADFTFTGIALLGEDIQPAVDGAEVKVLKYSTEEFNDEVRKTNIEIQNYESNNDEFKIEKGDVKVKNEDKKVETAQEEIKEEKATAETPTGIEEKASCGEKEENFANDEENVAKVEETIDGADNKEDEKVEEKASTEEEVNPVKEEPSTEDDNEELTVLLARITEYETKISETTIELTAYKEKYAKEVDDNKQLKDDYSSLTDKYTALQEEVASLKEYKFAKEKEELQAKADEKYAKYSKYVTSEEKESLQKVLFEKGFSDFSKELSSIVLPKYEAINETHENDKHEDVVKYSALSLPINETKKISTPESRLKDYLGC